MLALSVLVVLALSGVSHAFSQGAPSFQNFNSLPPMEKMSLCYPAPKPNHKNAQNQPIQPQKGAAPYELRVLSPLGPYQPNKKVTVELRGKTPMDKFKGFFIYVEPQQPTMKFGNWEADLGQNARPTTYCVPGITHTDGMDKNSVKVIWNPPYNPVENRTIGNVTFKATVVKSHDQFYTGVSSSLVESHPDYVTDAAYMKQEMERKMREMQSSPMMQQMMNVFKGFGAPGGQGGGMPSFDMGALRQQMAQMQKAMMSRFGGQGMPGMNSPGMGSPGMGSGQSNPGMGGVGGGLLQGLRGMLNSQGQGGGNPFQGMPGMSGDQGSTRQSGFLGGNPFQNPWNGR